MDRVSTAASYSAILNGINAAQNRLGTAQAQVSSGKLASDLKGYASQANALTATQAVSARLQAYADSGSALSDRLDAQAGALDGLSTAGTSARQAVFNSLATGDATTLMQQLQGWYQQASDSLNTNYQGQYLFGGGNSAGPPVTGGQVTDLADPATAADQFSNGSLKSVDRLDDNVTVQTGQLASDLGQPLFGALKTITDYVAANGPFTGKLTAAQTSFLQSTLSTFDSANAGISGAVAQTGVTQTRVAAAQASVTAQQTTADNVVSKITDADPAKALTDLQLAQVALQASAQVFSTLKASSLLTLLSNS